MGRTHKKVSISPAGIPYTPETAAEDVEKTLKMLEGRWKLLILFQLFDGGTRRFSELERAIPAVTQKMLAQQLRQLEHDGIVSRKVYPQIPPKVEYSLTPWGQSLCPALDALLKWAAKRPLAGLEPAPAPQRAKRMTKAPVTIRKGNVIPALSNDQMAELSMSPKPLSKPLK